MKKVLSFILVLALAAALLPCAVIPSSAEYAGYSETQIKTASFSSENYHKIYDASGNVLTSTEGDPDGDFHLRAPVQGDKTQEWQIVEDSVTKNRYRIISKDSGLALAIKTSPSVKLALVPVDLNSAEQMWTIASKSGNFTLTVRNVGCITFSGDRVRATSVTTGAKQFSICEIGSPAWVTDWIDEFDTFDESKWNRSDGHLQGADAMNTNVNDEEYSFVEDGNLVLRTTTEKRGGYSSVSGMVDTAGKYSLTYGRVDMVAKLPHGYGSFPALWLLGNENIWPGNGEIDVMEMFDDYVNNSDAYLYGTLHWTGGRNIHEAFGRTLYNKDKEAFYKEYHTYTLEWECDQIRMFFDGILYLSLNFDDENTRFAFGDDPHFIIIDNWLRGDQPDGTLMPGKEYEDEYLFYIDSIKVSKRENEYDQVEDETTGETTYSSTAFDLVARSHDWDNEMPMAISADGSEIAIADGLGVIYIEDANTGLQKTKMTVYPMTELSAIEYSPDGSKLVVSNLVGTILVYDTSDYGKEPLRICNGTVCEEQLDFTKDGKLITSGISARSFHHGGVNQFDGSLSEPKSIRIYDLDTGSLLHRIEIDGETRGLAVSPDGRTIAGAMFDGRCVLIDTEDYTVSGYIKCGSIQLRGVAFSHSGSTLAITDEAGEIYCVELSDTASVRKFETTTKTSMTAVQFSADDSSLLVNSSDNCARLYDAATGKLLKLLGGFSGIAHHAKFSPDGSRIAVGSYDGRIKIYDSLGNYRRTLVTSLTEHNGQIYDMSFSPDGEYIYATTYTVPKALHRWSVDGEQGAESVSYPNDFIYTVVDGEAVIESYRGNSRNIVIPEQIDGYPVTSIGYGAFLYYGNYIKNVSIKLPSTLKRIEGKAFLNVWSLREITLPEGLEYIGENAFHGCKQLYEVIIPDSVTELGENAFDWCHGLRKVVIGGGLKTVPANAFGDSRAIKEVIVSSGVEAIGSHAFGNADIEKIRLPETLVSCAPDAFNGSSVAVYGVKGGNIEAMCDKTFAYQFHELIRGDMDGDGEISVTDALCMLRVSVRLCACDNDTVRLMDMDNDTSITVSDALLVLRKAAGIE